MILLPDHFWQQVKATTENATASGALQPIPTAYEVIPCQGIPFLVRILTTLIQKEEAKAQQAQQKQKTGRDFDPFLPYEEDLFVSDISDTHLCLLNKYNVVENHLLIVTRKFEAQENLINYADLTALCACLKNVNGFAFYNSSKRSGASVSHKHLQLIPNALAPDFEELPITTALKTTQFFQGIQDIPIFPFHHAFSWLNLDWTATPETVAQNVLETYKQLLEIIHDESGVAYNFLMTRHWMLLVPRHQEKYQSIGINSLGFAGALLVKNQEELQLVKEQTPLKILTAVAKEKR